MKKFTLPTIFTTVAALIAIIGAVWAADSRFETKDRLNNTFDEIEWVNAERTIEQVNEQIRLQEKLRKIHPEHFDDYMLSYYKDKKESLIRSLPVKK